MLINHSEPFAFCHSEGAERPKNLLFTPFRASAPQGKLREGAVPFFPSPSMGEG